MGSSSKHRHHGVMHPSWSMVVETLFHWRIPLGIGLIVLLVLFSYFPAWHGGFVLDDKLLTQNKLVKSATGLYRIWFTTEPTDYWPVTTTAC